jgi:O-methyltransferase
MKLHPLVAIHPLVSDQVSAEEVSIILEQLEGVLAHGHRGATVEFGCFVGTTSLFLRRLLNIYQCEGTLHVYDSFEGLPEKSPQDQSAMGVHFKAGELAATKKQLLQHFAKARLKPPIVHKAWFDQLTGDDAPDQIMFAFLDGDFYESVRVPLTLITPKLLPDAVIVVDDYANEALPGARRAVDEWCKGRDVHVQTWASLAIIQT